MKNEKKKTWLSFGYVSKTKKKEEKMKLKSLCKLLLFFLSNYFWQI